MTFYSLDLHYVIKLIILMHATDGYKSAITIGSTGGRPCEPLSGNSRESSGDSASPTVVSINAAPSKRLLKLCTTRGIVWPESTYSVNFYTSEYMWVLIRIIKAQGIAVQIFFLPWEIWINKRPGKTFIYFWKQKHLFQYPPL